MPEGPEIRLAADRLGAALAGQRVEKAELTPPALRAYGARLSGSRVSAVDTRGKAMLTRFDNGLTLYSHNQLYGRWYVQPRDRLPRTGRSLRVALHTERASVLLYSASDIAVLDEPGLSAHPFLARLGPDLLDPALTWRALAARLAEAPFAGRRLGGLYLDQGFVAGIGNYLRSEILFEAGLHPEWRPRDLSRGRRNRLARATLVIGQRAYRARGVTVSPSLAARLKAAGLPRRRYRFAVFDRAGEPCHACARVLQRVSVGSRRLYFCPTCQAPAGAG